MGETRGKSRARGRATTKGGTSASGATGGGGAEAPGAGAALLLQIVAAARGQTLQEEEVSCCVNPGNCIHTTPLLL